VTTGEEDCWRDTREWRWVWLDWSLEVDVGGYLYGSLGAAAEASSSPASSRLLPRSAVSTFQEF